MVLLVARGLLALIACGGGGKFVDGDDLPLDTAEDSGEPTGDPGDDDGSGGGDDTGRPGNDTAPPDADGDGWPDGEDCDDDNEFVSPDGRELCNGVDDDCDSAIDEDFTILTWYADGDGDGFGVTEEAVEDCAPPADYSATPGDCDDGDREVYPGAVEICGDGVDNDCDGLVGSDCGMEPDLELSGADVILSGQSDDDQSGQAVDAAGDVDGDGVDDLLIGAYNRTGRTGAAYLVYGPVTADMDLGSADALISGERPGGATGYQLAGLGDTDGDGLGDLALTTIPVSEDDVSEIHLLRGPLSGPTSTSAAEAVLLGSSYDDYAGFALGRGDINDDGLADLMVGASGVTGDAGAVYLVTGPVTGTLTLDVDVPVAIDSANSGDRLGYNGLAAADLNGDGVQDVAAGAPTAAASGVDGGVVFLFYGPLTDRVSTLSSDAAVSAEALSDQLGYDLAAAGDVDDDGYQDLLVSANANDEAGSGAGAAYLLAGPLSGAISAADARARLLGSAPGDYAGDHVAGPGDVNADGYDDLLVTALGADATAVDAGATWMVYGPVSGTVDLGADADVQLRGAAAGDYAGALPGGPMDLDNDGVPDLVIGARQAEAGGADRGATYVIFGIPGTL